MADRDRGEEPGGVVGADGRLTPHPRRPGDAWPTLPERPDEPSPTTSPVSPMSAAERAELQDLLATTEESPLGRFLKRFVWKLAVPLALIPVFVIIGVAQCQSETERTQEIRDLPGVIAVDNRAQRIVLADGTTRDQARRVVDRAHHLSPGWKLSVGVLTMELLKGRSGYEAATGLYRPLDVLLRLDAADLTRFRSVFLSLQAVPSVAVLATLSDGAALVPATRGLANAAGDQADLISVHSTSSSIAITRPPVPPAAFDALAELPRFADASLARNGGSVTLRATPANADRTCRTAAKIFAAHRLAVRLSYVTDPGPAPEPKPC